jgi:hypothetical protein
MAAAVAGPSAAPLPSWVMLEPFVFRRDDPESFREDERTSASLTTSTGAPFRISFILAEPPTPSRLYISWPEGPKKGVVCHLVAAHRDLVLLRLDSVITDSSPKLPKLYNAVVPDYFVYISGPSIPSLKRLPAYDEYSCIRPVRLSYQPPTNNTFLSEQTSHQQPASNTFLSERINTNH